jgi:mannan endo-1,4-beta-mannosidase
MKASKQRRTATGAAASRLLWLGLFAVLSVGHDVAAAKAKAPDKGSRGFVTRSGHEFVLNGKTFRVAGVNNHYLTYGSRVEVTRVLDDAVAMNANVVRIFVSPIIGSTDGSVANVFNWNSKADSSNLGVNGVYMASFNAKSKEMEINEGANGLQRLDFVVNEASKRKLRLIVAFVDYWAYTGGSRQIGAWYGNKGDDLFFAEDARARADYKRLVQAIVTRRNSLSKVIYRDDPTIFAWELANEPDIQPFSVFNTWVAEMAAFVKTLDNRHLLASGQSSLKYKMAELRLPQVDFGTWHGYASYQEISAEQFADQITEFCAYAVSYDKPVVLEEFGLPRSDPERPQIYRNWLARIADDDRCAGWLVWRLVSRQDSNEYPQDDHDQFDIHNDGSPVWLALKDSAGLMTTARTRHKFVRQQEDRGQP